MLTSKQLDKCLELLNSAKDEVSSKASLEGILEVMYFLKKERDIVIVEESTAKRTADPKLLIRDNIQLIKENDTLKSNNRQLLEIVNKKFPHIMSSMENVSNKIETLCKIHQ